MRYKYKISHEELEQAFGDLLEIRMDFDDEDEESEFKVLIRKGQNFNKVYQVNITTPNHAKILLDYLSYDKSTWDYEPKLCVSMFGTIINFQRRGNMGHLHQLELGDMFIVDSWVKEQYAERSIPQIPKGNINLRNGYYELLKAYKTSEDTIDVLKKEIERLSKEISNLKNTDKKDDLPF